MAGPLGIGVEEAAYKVVEEAISIAAKSIADVLSQAGVPAGDCSLFAAGGAGGTLCHGIAGRLGIAGTHFFRLGAVFCAFGLSTMDVVHRYESAQTVTLQSKHGSQLSGLDAFSDVVLGLQKQALRDMRGEGFDPEKIRFSLELRIAAPEGQRSFQSSHFAPGSSQDVKVICEACCDRFASAAGTTITVELFRLTASTPVYQYEFARHADAGRSPDKALKGRRSIYWRDAFVESRVYEEKLLKHGNVVDGPSVIESEETTILVPPGSRYTVDQYLNGRLESQEVHKDAQ